MELSKEFRFFTPSTAILVIITAIALSPSLFNGWVNWDDSGYVLNNLLVQELSLDSIKRLFTTSQVMGLYHPLTLLSLAVDYHFTGDSPIAFHVSNLVLHLINVMLVFVVFRKITKNNAASFITALLFGIHPMHVESVAWISSRKDVLSAMFFLCGLLTYTSYMRGFTRRNQMYIVTFVLFILALLSKATAIVFPIILLLIDYVENRGLTKKVLVEKIPFLVTALFFGVLTIYTQKEGNALQAEGIYSGFDGFFSGVYALGLYMMKAIVPYKLSAFHPYPTSSSGGLPWYVYAMSIPVTALTFYIFQYFRHKRHVVFGFGFFLISILPLIQFLPFGQALIADRYSYISYIGLFYLIGVWVSKYTENTKNSRKSLLLGLMTGYILILVVLTFQRTKVWMNGDKLWSDVIGKYPDDYFAYGTRASYWMSNGDLDAALRDYEACIDRAPCFAEAHNNRGLILWESGDNEEALLSFNRAVQCDSSIADAYTNRGLIYLNNGEYDMAMREFDHSILLDPNDLAVYYNRGLLFQRLNNHERAIDDYSLASSLDPNNSLILKERSNAYRILTRYGLAVEDVNRAIEIENQDGEAYFLRSMIYKDQGNFVSALTDAQYSISLGYHVPDAYMEALRIGINDSR